MAFTVLITGGIGSGKSAVSKYLENQGVPVYDSDSRTKALYQGELGHIVENAFGVALRKSDGSMDFRHLSELVFGDSAALTRLESIVHPEVLEDFERWSEEVLNGMTWTGYAGTKPLVCMESAIALDKPLFHGRFNKTIAVVAPEDIRIERACGRDGCDRQRIEERIKCQRKDFPEADYIIYNDGTLDKLYTQVDNVFQMIAADQVDKKQTSL